MYLVANSMKICNFRMKERKNTQCYLGVKLKGVKCSCVWLHRTVTLFIMSGRVRKLNPGLNLVVFHVLALVTVSSASKAWLLQREIMYCLVTPEKHLVGI